MTVFLLQCVLFCRYDENRRAFVRQFMDDPGECVEIGVVEWYIQLWCDD